MEVDPVCGMQINAHTAAASSVYNGQTYHFCSTACKAEFERSPEQYVSKAEAA